MRTRNWIYPLLLIIILYPIPSHLTEASWATLTLEEMTEQATLIITANVTGPTRPLLGSYSIFNAQIERTYKGTPLQEAKIFIDDSWQWTFPHEGKYLLFLTDNTPVSYKLVSMGTYYQVTGDVAEGVFNNLRLTEKGWELMPPGVLTVESLTLPENQTVNDLAQFSALAKNTGGQPLFTMNVTFLGISGLAYGAQKDVKTYVGFDVGYEDTVRFEANFSLPGVYEIIINDVKMGSLVIYEAGYLSEGITFSNLRFNTTTFSVGSMPMAVWDITNQGDVPRDVAFLLSYGWYGYLDQAKQRCEVHVDGKDTVAFPFQLGFSDPGAYYVKVIYRGVTVLSSDFTVLPAQPLNPFQFKWPGTELYASEWSLPVGILSVFLVILSFYVIYRKTLS